jgi:hypothetical protein
LSCCKAASNTFLLCVGSCTTLWRQHVCRRPCVHERRRPSTQPLG